MKDLINRLHARLGDFWWYSLLMFAALRCGDLINAVVGLWLVPKYVPQEELGAVLPLTQFATTFGLPISILVAFFTRYLAIFKANGEQGKIKSLLKWFFGFILIAALLSAALAKWTLPALFERIRIEDGSLTILIIATGVINTVAPVFNNALQGLKKFKTITFLNLIGAPIRLVSMLILLPIRALSGYMAGQLIPSIVGIITSVIAIRKDVDKSIASVPFWAGNVVPMLKYIGLYALWVIPGAVFGTIQTMLIRQRLPDIESAAYYMISRFSEVAMFAGTTLTFIMFPMAAEDFAKKASKSQLLLKVNIATIAFGIVLAIVLAFVGRFVFSKIPAYVKYLPYVTDMVLLSLILVSQQVSTNYTTFESIHNRFGHIFFTFPVSVMRTSILVAGTGYTFFYGLIPGDVVDWIGSLKMATLRVFLLVILVSSIIQNIILLWRSLYIRRVSDFVAQ